MRLSHLSSLAIHYLAYMAASGRQFMEAGEVRRFLVKKFGLRVQGISYFYYMTERLIKAGLVAGRRGRGGGLAFQEPPAKITLRRVVEAVEGPVVEAACAISYKDEACRLKARCPLDALMLKITRPAARILDGISVEEFGKRLKVK